ncbi:hypothetical protein UFOVP398_59 [uncultured Caudovirales phage]|uniref:Uncharacterized protein n=1 Tax=uncultured Caudovirales phage TaxID=2100421 RepID=A0A6J5M1G3_9CAUD|nr:hypothetical protein UFOVP398_59 [uncultured Caudovirales phage]
MHITTEAAREIAADTRKIIYPHGRVRQLAADLVAERKKVEDLEAQLAKARKDGERLVIAFVQGAKWWEFEKTGATMWQSDQAIATVAARERLKRGALGIPMEEAIAARQKEGKE